MATVAVAVKSADGRGSRRAVRWAIENLMHKADRLVLVRVMPTQCGSIAISEVDGSVAETYTQDIQSKCEENLLTIRYQYRKEKIETLLLEGDDPAVALLRYISDSGATSLVLGSCPSKSNYSSRTPKESEVPSVVLKHAPDTCKIYVVSATKIISNSVNPASITESKYKNYLSDVRHLRSDSQTSTLSSVNSDAAEETFHQSLEESRSDMSRNNGFLPISSTRSEQPDIRAEIERLRLEVENTVSMYNRACKDLVHAQSKVQLLSSECIQEAQRVNAAQERAEKLRKFAALEREKYLEAEEEVEKAKTLLAEETYERQMAELMVQKESLEKNKMVDALLSGDRRYRRYTRDDIHIATGSFDDNKLIGEGAYGKVYKCSLDHTLVAVKTLHREASERKKEFLTEIDVLSQLRHPNLVLLLGACPEIGCLVYEYMDNGSLEDHILPRRGNPPLPWPVRFRIAFEVASGLAFLHHSKPEPIVHRDLKPGNILLDKYFVSKIGDVGLAKFISDLVPDNITEYGESVIAGVIILQLLAARHPNGLILKFEKAMSSGSFFDVLDKSVSDWPLAEAVELIQVALKCCKLRCRDRPDLVNEVLPVLKRLADFADSSSSSEKDLRRAHKHYYCPILQEIMENPYIAVDGFTYEHYAIKAWLDRHNVSPVTKQKLQNKTLTPNHTLHAAIQEWKQRVKAV